MNLQESTRIIRQMMGFLTEEEQFNNTEIIKPLKEN